MKEYGNKKSRDVKGNNDRRNPKNSKYETKSPRVRSEKKDEVKSSRVRGDKKYETTQSRVKNEEIRPLRVKTDEVIENKPVREDLVEGRNAVIEALKSDRTIEQILIAKGDMEGSINVILGLAREKSIVIKEVDRRKLDLMSETSAHQGVIAIVTPYNYYEIDDIFKYAKEKGEKPFIMILDEIEDPHNFGSIIRTAEICGVHGIIIPKRKNVGVTPTVYKTSAGAIEHMRIAKVTNINVAIDKVKDKGVWVYGADMEGKDYCFNTDFTGAVALVVGSEGRGISKLTKEKCDVLVKIPMMGKITSLNASVAGGILMYEVMKQKIK